MTRTLILTMAALLAACSEPVRFDREIYQSEYKGCFEAMQRSYMQRGSELTVQECRAAAMAIASYGE